MDSREAQFLVDMFNNFPMPKNPMIAIFYQQLKKLSDLVDGDVKYQQKVAEILDYIKENW